MALDLNEYYDRIGYRGATEANLDVLRDLVTAHTQTIPFENLDPQRGVAISLEPEQIQRKLVSERRGGYCFEQNLLLAQALELPQAVAD